MKIVPLAADSLGVRSMATYVECGQTRVVIDPGASLGASRFNLPPSDEEWDALKRANDRICAYATRADLVFVSHYHEDHFRYDPTIYRDKNVWVKDPRRMVGARQAGRAALLWKALQGTCRLDAAEGRRLETPDVVLTASPPLSHGVDGTALGYVVALTITDRREGQRFVHASDVQGPLSPVALAYLIRERPDFLYLSGPPAYLESQVGSAPIERGIDHLLRVIEATGCRAVLDHHALRAADYRERFRRLWETGRVQTAAGFLGLADTPLEARRRELWSARRKPPAPMRPRRGKEGRPSTVTKSRRAPDLAKEGTTQ
jgi:predicted metallo-beta-lactamase superfamily hydrolase